MKTTKTFYYTFLFFAYFLFNTPNANAHFGSKGPFGGTVSVAISYNGLVYLGTANGGVFESTNSALVAWRARPVGLKSGKITALTHSGLHLFAGTEDSGIYIFNGFVGNDRYWNQINNGLGTLKITSLQAIDSMTILAGTDQGLYKTTDRGANWSLVNDADVDNKQITAMALGGTRLFLASSGAGVFYSDDAGDTWSDFNDGNTQNVSGTRLLSYNMATEELYVVNGNGLFKAGSVTSTTTPSYTAGTGLPLGVSIRGIGSNLTHWYLATDLGVFAEDVTNPGWTATSNGLPNVDVTAIGCGFTHTVAAVRDAGMFKTDHTAAQWASFNTNFNNQSTYAMATGGDSLVVAATEQGVFVSKDLAATYVKSNTGLTDSLHVNDLLLAKHLLFAATTSGGVFMSADSGKTWTSDGLSSQHIVKLFYANDIKYALDVMGILYESPLLSASWTPAAVYGFPNAGQASSMCFYDEYIYVGTLHHGVFRRKMGDTAWSDYNTGIGSMNITALAASGGRIFAGTTGSGIFTSDAKVAGWNAAATPAIPHSVMLNLPSNSIQAMAANSGFIFASYHGGLVCTADSGQTWIPGGNQFNLPSFTDVKKVSFVNTRVFVTTENNGLYSNSLSELPAFEDTFLVLSRATANFDVWGGRTVVTVNSNSTWTASVNDPWMLSLSYSDSMNDGSIAIDVSWNRGWHRVGQVTVTAGSLSKTIVVSQIGADGLKELERDVLLYPNPNNGSFQLDLSELPDGVEGVTVLNAMGNKVQEWDGDGSTNLRITGLQSSGLYFVQIRTKQGTLVKKVTVYQ